MTTAAATLLLLCAQALADTPPPADTAQTPTPPQRIIYEEIDLIGEVQQPEIQILLTRQPLPDLSTTELLEQIDARLETLADERD